jgi:hypothetical protein
MPGKADIAIGLAMFARSLIACEAALPAPDGALPPHARQSVSPAPDLALLTRRQSRRGLSNDPARSRPSVTPIGGALYETCPAEV